MNLATKKYVEEQLADLSTIDAADKTKLDGIETGATAVPTVASTMAHTGVVDSDPYWKADA